MKYSLLILMTGCGAIGAFLLKLASDKIDSLKKIFITKELYIGGIFYVIGALLNIYLLGIIPYSIIMPLNALTYIWTFLLGIFILKEKVNKNKLISMGFICIGIIFLASGLK